MSTPYSDLMAGALVITVGLIIVVDMAVSGGRSAKTMAGAGFWLGCSTVAAAFLVWSIFLR